ncbi:hypothetical protein CGCF415_v006851 [Colletotrichum fructicola]|uniref:Heterokaryon incompatibility protein n=2 Tax=Colletotrichum fructicola (strain Nara gc5) TaxID=1213859 RepID=L2FYV3_COLFN|nr:hypothetical protein CGCFRS4_v005779 [Colletotrichum fructicola]KAF4908214.1 hypothetical protein CGCF415_v006851 [Colletotrichum fructicola]KAF4939751.1 hypothetical protein CGCF245_v003442 [Colletotrichum fructicola]
MELSISTRNGTLQVSESLETARRWMHLCSETHQECGNPNHTSTFPTRLLKIRAAGLQLILTEVEKPTGAYATLSYCWGPPPYEFPRLTTSNIGDMFRSEIPNIALPVAFREAIGFVQELGIQYIWIDSLCIIQDGARSNDDWTFESSRMKSVYSNSAICLSLDRARSPQDSVIYGPDVQFMTPFEINTTGIFDENDLAAESKRCAVFSSQHFNNALYDQPLGSRAWALQERMLPPRVLGFGEGELFWSCRQVPHACESLPSGTASLPDRSLGLRSSFIPITSDSADLYDTWFGLVMDYSGRKLTCPEKDKLVAMSAVAALMETATKDKCIVGHFWKSIPFSLMWDGFGTPFHGSDESLEIRKRLRIPSWSWASEHRTVLSTDAFWA